MRLFMSLGCVLVLLFSTTKAEAAGFQNPEHSVRAGAMGHAYTAIADDSSAVFYNPGALGFLRGLQSSNNFNFGRGRVRFRSRFSRETTENRQKVLPAPGFFGSYGFYDNDSFLDRVTLGFGFYIPYGLELQFPDQAATRYESILGSLRAQFFTPSVGIRVFDWLSVGAGFSYVTTRRVVPGLSKEGMRIQRTIDLSQTIFDGLRSQLPASTPDSAVRTQARNIAATIPEPKTRLKSDLDGTGYNFGFLIKALPEKPELLRLGFTYRSEVNLRTQGLSGDVDFAGVEDPIGLPPGTVTGALIRSHFTTNILLPPSFSIAVASEMMDRLTLSFQADWTGWTTFDRSAFRIRTGSPFSVQVVDQNYNDVWALRFGFEYLLCGSYAEIRKTSQKGPLGGSAEPTEEEGLEAEEQGFALALRLGYVWDESPVPVETLDAVVPDNDRHAFSFGLGFDFNWVRLDTSFRYIDLKTIRKTNTNEDVDEEIHSTQGKFNTDIIIVGIAATFRF